jgi:hypothetical protein
MRIISFSTEETHWKEPRFGVLVAKGDSDTGFRLDCEKLFVESERPPNLLSWFDMVHGSKRPAKYMKRSLTM